MKYPMIIFILLFSLLQGCDSGDDNTVQPGADAATDTAQDLSEGLDSVNAEDQADQPDTVAAPIALVCPVPGALPFSLDSDEFTDATLTQAAAQATFNLDINQDLMGLPGTEQVVTGRFMRGDNPLLGQVFPDQWVSLWSLDSQGAWTSLGRTKTDAEGAYSFELVGDKAFEIGSHATYGILEGDGSCEIHGVFLWPAGTKVVVTDIDGTMTMGDGELAKQVVDQTYDQLEIPAASDMVSAWADKGYKVLYLTARIDLFRAPTRTWLDAHGMPFGPLITTEKLTQDEATREYKANALLKVKQEFGWDLVAAYGNAITDVQAYEDAGIPKNATFSIGEASGELGTVAIPTLDYSDHIVEYVSIQPDAVQPF